MIVFFLIIASIFGLLSYKLVLIIVLVTACILDFHLLKKLDYLLLITFVCFFIFVGNISNIDIVHSLASESLRNSTSVYFSSIFLSQFISNVPVTILLSNFFKKLAAIVNRCTYRWSRNHYCFISKCHFLSDCKHKETKGK